MVFILGTLMYVIEGGICGLYEYTYQYLLGHRHPYQTIGTVIVAVEPFHWRTRSEGGIPDLDRVLIASWLR